MWESFFIFAIAFVGCNRCIFGQQISEIKTPKINLPIWPVWDDNTQSLYFIDFLAPATANQKTEIYRYDFNDGTLYTASIPGVKSIAFFYPVRQNCKECKNIFVIGDGHGTFFIKWNGKSTTAQLLSPQSFFNVEENDPKSHLNVAQADPSGRLFMGTISQDFCQTPADKSFYRYTTNRGVDRIFGGIRGTSGIAIDERAKKLYHTDYCSLLITAFDYDPSTGDVCNGRIVFDFKSIGQTSDSMVPQGLAIDNNGYLYTADYRHSVYVIDPKMGKVVRVIDMGIEGVSGVVFGGPKRDILFVPAASAIVNTTSGKPVQIITTGSALYKVTDLCVTGAKSTRFKVPDACQKPGC